MHTSALDLGTKIPNANHNEFCYEEKMRLRKVAEWLKFLAWLCYPVYMNIFFQFFTFGVDFKKLINSIELKKDKLAD